MPHSQRNNTSNRGEEFEEKQSLKSTIRAIPQPPALVFPSILSAPIHTDTLILTQCSELKTELAQLNENIAATNITDPQLAKIVSLFSSIPPPLPPLFPQIHHKTKKLLNGKTPEVGKGNGMIVKKGKERKKKDVYSDVCKDQNLFQRMSGLSLEIFEKLLSRSKETILRSNHSDTRVAQFSLSVQNRLLLFLMVLKGYSYAYIQHTFDVSKAYISQEFRHILTSVVSVISDQIQWPSTPPQNPHPILLTSGNLDHTHFKVGRTRYNQSHFSVEIKATL
jgi:hypothetical protein